MKEKRAKTLRMEHNSKQFFARTAQYKHGIEPSPRSKVRGSLVWNKVQ
jgi:hypothetical protein